MFKVCGRCEKTFETDNKKRKWCSSFCYYATRRGQKDSDEVRKKKSAGRLQYFIENPDAHRGENNPAWKGGNRPTTQGYTVIEIGSRKNGSKKVLAHRIIMEKKIGRSLDTTERVHHWDENKLNNAEDNLCLFRHQNAHQRLHQFATRHGIPVLELKFEQPWLTP